MRFWGFLFAILFVATDAWAGTTDSAPVAQLAIIPVLLSALGSLVGGAGAGALGTGALGALGGALSGGAGAAAAGAGAGALGALGTGAGAAAAGGIPAGALAGIGGAASNAGAAAAGGGLGQAAGPSALSRILGGAQQSGGIGGGIQDIFGGGDGFEAAGKIGRGVLERQLSGIGSRNNAQPASLPGPAGQPAQQAFTPPPSALEELLRRRRRNFA